MSDDDQGGWSFMDEPFAYAVFPLICLVIAIFIASILYTRRRRLRIAAIRNGQWPQDHGPPRDGTSRTHRARGSGNRWAPWGGTRTDEGLNELGEAPPPYDGKREGDGRREEVELGDLEMNRPPRYPAEPGPAVVRDTRPTWA